MKRTDRIRHELAKQLLDDDALRAEAAQLLAKWSGKPSDRYRAWKHDLNALADELRVPRRKMTERVIAQAIRLSEKRNAEHKPKRRKRK